jgi:hypothetical protein
MAGHEIWHTEPDGDVSAVVQNLKLIVRKDNAYTRYLVLRGSGQGRDYADVLLASGSEYDVSAAMIAATRIAIRIASG